MFDIRTGDDDGTRHVILVSGELDMTVRGHLRAHVAAATAAGSEPWLIVDLARVTLIDSTAVQELLDAQRLAAARGRILIVRNATGVVADVLRVTGVAAALGLPRDDNTGTVYTSQRHG